MISQTRIRELAVLWQTTEINVIREFIQHAALCAIYSLKDAGLAFKGGTALRILRASPRFSEDLDFTGWLKPYAIPKIISRVTAEINRLGINFEEEVSSPTSGGWLAIFKTQIYSLPVTMEFNISLRSLVKPKTELVLVVNELHPAYTVEALNEECIVKEKIQAALSRKKPRDFFDIYFLLRSRVGVMQTAKAKKNLLELIKNLDRKVIEGELKNFLPKSHWQIAKNLPQMLKSELEKF